MHEGPTGGRDHAPGARCAWLSRAPLLSPPSPQAKPNGIPMVLFNAELDRLRGGYYPRWAQGRTTRAHVGPAPPPWAPPALVLAHDSAAGHRQACLSPACHAISLLRGRSRAPPPMPSQPVVWRAGRLHRLAGEPGIPWLTAAPPACPCRSLFFGELDKLTKEWVPSFEQAYFIHNFKVGLEAGWEGWLGWDWERVRGPTCFIHNFKVGCGAEGLGGGPGRGLSGGLRGG